MDIGVLEGFSSIGSASHTWASRIASRSTPLLPAWPRFPTPEHQIQRHQPSASEQRGNNLKRFEDLYLKAKASPLLYVPCSHLGLADRVTAALHFAAKRYKGRTGDLCYFCKATPGGHLGLADSVAGALLGRVPLLLLLRRRVLHRVYVHFFGFIRFWGSYTYIL